MKVQIIITYAQELDSALTSSWPTGLDDQKFDEIKAGHGVHYTVGGRNYSLLLCEPPESNDYAIPHGEPHNDGDDGWEHKDASDPDGNQGPSWNGDE